MTPQQMANVLQKLVEDARAVLEDAVRFEGRIIVSATFFKGIAFLEQMGGLPFSLAELLKWKDDPRLLELLNRPPMTLHSAAGVVEKNLRGEIPDLRENLKKGENIRNRVIHNVGHLIGNAEGAVSTLPDILRFYNGDMPIMSNVLGIFSNAMEKLGKEMAESCQFSAQVYDAAHQKLMDALVDMDVRRVESGEILIENGKIRLLPRQ